MTSHMTQTTEQKIYVNANSAPGLNETNSESLPRMKPRGDRTVFIDTDKYGIQNQSFEFRALCNCISKASV